MATQAKEANPYNADKDWHKQDEKQFVSADGAFFEEPKRKVEGQEEEDNQRHINVVKNKLSGWHGIVHTDLEYKIARYVS